jgi:radical SAM protein with 4Fe4S-binding SPASM domain
LAASPRADVGRVGYRYPHKCGLEVDDSSQAIGKLGSTLDEKNNRFASYSPVTNPVCRECSFLPTCLGGCPRNQLNRREVQLKENCEYYQQFEQQILLFHLGHRNGVLRILEPQSQPTSAALFPILT